MGVFELLEHSLQILLQLSYTLSILSTECAVAVTCLNLSPYSELVARFFKIDDIPIGLKSTKRTVRGRRLVYPNGPCQESKDMRVQLCYGRLKVGASQRYRQMIEKLDIGLKPIRYI